MLRDSRTSSSAAPGNNDGFLFNAYSGLQVKNILFPDYHSLSIFYFLFYFVFMLLFILFLQISFQKLRTTSVKDHPSFFQALLWQFPLRSANTLETWFWSKFDKFIDCHQKEQNQHFKFCYFLYFQISSLSSISYYIETIEKQFNKHMSGLKPIRFKRENKLGRFFLWSNHFMTKWPKTEVKLFNSQNFVYILYFSN